MGKYLTAAKLAEELGIAKKTVLNKTQLGQIPCRRLPGSSRPRYILSEVESYMSTGKRSRRRVRGRGRKSAVK